MNFDFKVLYVNDIGTSSQFYADMLGKDPIEHSESFTMFPLDNGNMLGLKTIQTVEPKTQIKGGGTEQGFMVKTKKEVDDLYMNWKNKGFKMAQTPTEVSYGYTFVVVDPDGHRVRVLCSSSS